MDNKVNGISGDWDAGCALCGQYLDDHKLTCGGWYCKKAITGIWLKRDATSPQCNPSLNVELHDTNVASELVGAVSCGNGMTVDSAGSVMDNKVMGISGEWEAGCALCGQYLQEHKLTCGGWYCKKAITGIWLKRDATSPQCNPSLNMELPSSTTTTTTALPVEQLFVV